MSHCCALQCCIPLIIQVTVTPVMYLRVIHKNWKLKIKCTNCENRWFVVQSINICVDGVVIILSSFYL